MPKHAPRRARSRQIETLESRQVMSADPVSDLLGGAIQHHAFQDAEPPSLVHHHEPDADFWLDPWSERDVDALVGDIEQTLASAHNSTGLTTARNDYGFIGTGQTVAIIDSGIAWDHYALGGGFGPDYRVVGGWDFTEENDGVPYDDGPSGSHGTHVAGIVGADRSGTTDDGVAPGVDLVALRVFNDAGDGFFSWTEKALRWVHENRNAFENPITAVNLSLGAAWNSTSLPAWSVLEEEFAQLKADGIFISVSAGNSFSQYNTPGLAYPAASPHVVPVMAVRDNGTLANFSQRHPTAIAAPGQSIVSTVPDYIGNQNGINDDFASFSGTSMAAPYVAGASVLVREAMQFVGQSNITQDTIFDHMMATATTFFDAATNLDYKRLNLGAALDALMPTDDYGSTLETAYNLGSLSGTSEIAGLIGKISDADYFQFTASATGTVTFTASTTHSLAPVWTGSGGVVSGDGTTFTFNVVAGQSYTVGLSTSGGIGYYDLTIEAESAFTYVDWGTVTQSQVNNLGNSGETWYRVQASQTGYLTAEAFYSPAAGNVQLALCDSNLQVLSSGASTASGGRVDWMATPGTEYFLRVTGTNADVSFRLTNLVSQSGTTVLVSGTSGDDVFSFTAGSTHQLAVNGVSYSFAGATSTSFQFSGGGGADTITLVGTTGSETAMLRATSAELSGAAYSAVADGVETSSFHGGGGYDTAYLYDSAGDDEFHAWSNAATLSGPGFHSSTTDCDVNYAMTSGGTDIAYLYDSAGDDLYRAWATHVVMSGSGFYNYAQGFDLTYAFATTGNDTSRMYDSAGDDLYRAWSTHVVMSGNGFYNYAQGFDLTHAYASTGNDTSRLYDTAGNDLFRAWSTHAVMSGNGYYNCAQGFDLTYGYASTGYDISRLYDSAGDDLFRAWSTHAVMSGSGYYNYAQGFDLTYAYATTGNDTSRLYDSAGDDLYRAWSTHVVMSGDGYYNYAQGFDLTYAYATTGNDISRLYDSAGNDLFRTWSTHVVMSGDGYYNCAQGFDLAYGYASTGYDTSRLYDSAGDDLFRAWPTYAVMSGNGYYNCAQGFDSVHGYSTAGKDTSRMYDSPGDDLYRTWPTHVVMSGDGFYNCAQGFGLTYAYSTTGNDTSRHFDSLGDDLFRAWHDWSVMSGNGYYNAAIGFDRTIGNSSSGRDKAILYDSPANDTVMARVWGAALTSGACCSEAHGFGEIAAHAILGGADIADVEAVDYTFDLLGNWG